MTDQANFQIQNVDGVPLIAVSGEIDLANVGQFKFFIAQAAANGNGPMLCSSSGSPRIGPPLVCSTGTQTQLASPTLGQTGVSPNVGQVIAVANGNTNTLYNSYAQWQVTLVDNFGNPTTGGQLRLVSDPSGPHPYPSDFYYSSSMPQLATGRTFSAFLSLTNGSCSPVSLGSFSS